MPVYLVRAGETDMVKIGWADEVQRRIEGLQIGHYLELHLLRTWPGRRGVEWWLHQRFADHRVRSEWFRFIPEMLTIELPSDTTLYLGVEFADKKESMIAALHSMPDVTYPEIADKLGIPRTRFGNWVGSLRSSGLVPNRNQRQRKQPTLIQSPPHTGAIT
jgi:hypothetical protein